MRGEFGAVIADDHRRHFSGRDERIELTWPLAPIPDG
jgi:hypothetical protein